MKMLKKLWNKIRYNNESVTKSWPWIKWLQCTKCHMVQMYENPINYASSPKSRQFCSDCGNDCFTRVKGRFVVKRYLKWGIMMRKRIDFETWEK